MFNDKPSGLISPHLLIVLRLFAFTEIKQPQYLDRDFTKKRLRPVYCPFELTR
ncbi:hypothetical protein [Sediminibacillus albus]|uniref:Uncharacterized protein n=1 Tax=Sediminibacillus albus TaxID=407036 RepID=A0A1G8W9N4_9BACI|nr:hypothetical protein [Sediminibacillus albus]SDJ74974.1 hypothetical protein SAMN05216243_0645 [Sediminibacillus albus]